MSRNVWNPPSGYGRYGDLNKNIMKSPSPECYMTLLDIIHWFRHFTKSWPGYQTGPYHRFWCYYRIPGSFHRTFASGVASQQRTPTPPDTWSCRIWDLNLFWCWDNSFLNLSCLRTFWVSNIPRYFYFAWYLWHVQIPLGWCCFVSYKWQD